MASRAFSMRWWLALAFAGIAALTALAVAQVFNARSEDALRDRARELAAGTAVTAALEISAATTDADVPRVARRLGEARQVALFVYSADGALVTPDRARGIDVAELPNLDELLSAGLGGRRFVETVDGGRLITVALPLRGERPGALVAVTTRPDLEDALGIVRDEILRASLVAVIVGALAGLASAALITRRLRRIATAAAEIEQGRFGRELTPRFPDELGDLATTIDRMRVRLRESFDALEGERDRLNRLLEQLDEGVIAVDRGLRVEFANTRARRLTASELTAGEPLPDPWPDASLRETARSVLRPGTSARTLRVEPDGTKTYVVTFLPPPLASETSVIVITDVTEAERRERAEREFVTNAAHELRTPLAAMASAVEVLQGGAKDDPGARDRFLEIVERQTTRLTGLVHALLTLARAQTQAESIRLEPVEIAPLLREVERGLGNGSVAVQLCCDDVAALAHRELLLQALENLATNARKHAGDGVVTFRVAHLDDGHVRFDVEDDGPGMATQDAERAANRFYRAALSVDDGYGLGLSIVKEVVTAMNGQLSIDSRPGAGTTVSIVLEASPPPRGCR